MKGQLEKGRDPEYTELSLTGKFFFRAAILWHKAKRAILRVWRAYLHAACSILRMRTFNPSSYETPTRPNPLATADGIEFAFTAKRAWHKCLVFIDVTWMHDKP